jgi:hypothetical protein
MKSRLRFVICIGTCLFLLLGIKAQPQNRQTEPSSKGAWEITIVKASQPEKVNVLGGMIHGRSGAPPDNQRWLQLYVELTPPKPEESIAVKRIRVIDNSSVTYSALAIANVEDSPVFAFFEDIGRPDFSSRRSAGFGLSDKEGSMTAMVVKLDTTGETTLSLPKKQAARMFILFAVPSNTEKVHFQIENEARIVVPLAQKK